MADNGVPVFLAKEQLDAAQQRLAKQDDEIKELRSRAGELESANAQLLRDMQLRDDVLEEMRQSLTAKDEIITALKSNVKRNEGSNTLLQKAQSEIQELELKAREAEQRNSMLTTKQMESMERVHFLETEQQKLTIELRARSTEIEMLKAQVQERDAEKITLQRTIKDPRSNDQASEGAPPNGDVVMTGVNPSDGEQVSVAIWAIFVQRRTDWCLISRHQITQTSLRPSAMVMQMVLMLMARRCLGCLPSQEL